MKELYLSPQLEFVFYLYFLLVMLMYEVSSDGPCCCLIWWCFVISVHFLKGIGKTLKFCIYYHFVDGENYDILFWVFWQLISRVSSLTIDLPFLFRRSARLFCMWNLHLVFLPQFFFSFVAWKIYNWVSANLYTDSNISKTINFSFTDNVFLTMHHSCFSLMRRTRSFMKPSSYFDLYTIWKFIWIGVE